MSAQPQTKDPLVEVCIGTYCNQVRRAELFVDKPLHLRRGGVLRPVQVAYETWGTLNDEGTNGVLLLHALTGDSHAAATPENPEPGWFQGSIGEGRGLDPSRHFIICANWLGSNYGTSGPTAVNPDTGEPYGERFPQMTIDDISRVQKALLDHLGITRLLALVGASVGGLVALDMAARFPRLAAALIPIATSFRASPWVIAFHGIMRRVLSIGRDSGDPELERRALETARMIGMVTYRSRQEFAERYRRVRAELDWQDQDCSFAVESYLSYQGQKLDQRFNATSYELATRAADGFDLGEVHGSLDQAISRINARVLCVGVDTDHLFPLDDQREIVDVVTAKGRDATLGVIRSDNGHDGFLIEFEQLNRLIGPFLSSVICEEQL